MDELTVRVEAHDEGLGSDQRAALGRQLAQLVKDRIGVTIDVEVTDPHALERSLGKAKRIDDRRSRREGN
jgi:phenylacetate-CoA ligase